MERAAEEEGVREESPAGGDDDEGCDEKKKKQYTKLYHLLRQANASKYVQTDSTPVEVIPRLFLGSIGCVHSREKLEALGIRAVLSVGFGMKNPHPDHFVWMGVNILDSAKADFLRHTEPCHEFIEKGRELGGVVVHCHQGKSRSVTVVASYLMKTQGITLEAAMDLIRKQRPQADPNAGFIAQLYRYQRLLAADVPGSSSERTPAETE
eukprot:Sspe_Gene.106195::Locus_83443_Transcript_1_1_Confidence_1.000_Length_802::g.106195::m.106195